MLYTFNCKNKDCKRFNKKIDLDFKMSEIDKAKPLCELCSKEMKRLYSFSGMIKTGDGIK